MSFLKTFRKEKSFQVEKEVANLHDTVITLRHREEELKKQADSYHEEARKLIQDNRKDDARPYLVSWADYERRAKDCRSQIHNLEARKQDLIDAKVEEKVLKALEDAKNAQKKAAPFVSEKRVQDVIVEGQHYASSLDQTRATLSTPEDRVDVDEKVSQEMERLSREISSPLVRPPRIEEEEKKPSSKATPAKAEESPRMTE